MNIAVPDGPLEASSSELQANAPTAIIFPSEVFTYRTSSLLKVPNAFVSFTPGHMRLAPPVKKVSTPGLISTDFVSVGY